MTFRLFVLTFLYADPHYVPHRLHMPLHDPVISCKSRGSYGAHVLDHLAADGAGLTGGQVTVVALLQVCRKSVREFPAVLLKIGRRKMLSKAIDKFRTALYNELK